MSRFQKALVGSQKLRPVFVYIVESARLYEAFYRLLIHLTDIDIVHKLEKVLCGAVFLALFDNGLYSALSHVFYAEESKANLAVHHRKFHLACIYARRQHLYAHFLTISYIFGDLRRLAHHACHKRRHKFHRIIGLEVGRLIGKHSIGRRMALIEGILRKADHLIEDLLCNLARNAVSHAARNLDISRFIKLAIDKIVLFLEHHVGLFLAHRAAHKVGAPIGIAAEVAHYLHYLLLINHAAIGHGHDVLKRRMQICDFFRIFLVFDICRNASHRARPVKRDARDDVLKAVGLQIPHKLRHSTAFKLKYSLRISRGYERKDLRVVIFHFCKIYGNAVVFLYHRKRVVDHRQVSQSEEVHFEKAQLLYRSHRKLRGYPLIREVERHVFVYTFL